MKKMEGGARDMRAEGGVTASAQSGLERAFERDGFRGGLIESVGKFRDVRGTALDRDCPLPDRWNHLRKSERPEFQAGPTGDAEPRQSRRGEHRAIGYALFGDFFQARLDVAANLAEPHRRKKFRELEPSARTTGRDRFRRRFAGAEHEHIADIRPRQIAGDAEARCHFTRQIFRAVHRHIRLAAQQRGFELTGKQAFPTLVLERPVRLPIAGRDDFQQLRLDAKNLPQTRRDHRGLRERERTLSGREDYFFNHGDTENTEEVTDRSP